MAQFECKPEEIKLLQRLRALQSAGFDQIRVGLRPLAILEKTDTRLELIEHPLAPSPPPLAGNV